MKLRLLPFCFGMVMTGCTALPVSHFLDVSVPENGRLQGEQSWIQIEGRTISAEFIQDFLIQKLKQDGIAPRIPAMDWRRGIPPGLERTPELSIQRITLAETGHNILGPNASDALVPELQGKMVELVLNGNFATKQDKDLKLNSFLFTLEPPLLHQSMVPGSKAPVSKVVLDDAILLTPISVSGTEIRVRLNTKGLLDLMLSGMHKLSLIHQRYYTDALIKIAKPSVSPGKLQPHIRSVEVIRNASKEPRFVKCLIDQAMTQPKFSYATLDGAFGFGYQTQVLEGETGLIWEVLIHVPEPATFDQSTTHTLTYSTPFGTTYHQF